jgi:hypothetical protein
VRAKVGLPASLCAIPLAVATDAIGPPAQYPSELKGATFKPGSRLYALEPAGTRFAKPVTVTRRLNAKLQGFDLGKAVPGIVLATRSPNGRWELLGSQQARPAGNTSSSRRRRATSPRSSPSTAPPA